MGTMKINFNFTIFKRLFFFLLLMISIITAGTIGFMFIEGWSLVDSVYMTIITMSTVGFGEVQELSIAGKIFTSLLIVSCFGIFAYAISTVTHYIVGGEYGDYLKEYRIIKKIHKMENHIIICGFGRVGKQVASDLKLQGQSFIILEKNETVVSNYRKNTDYTFLHGDATNDGVLFNANISNAKAVITCLPKDTDNVYVVLAAREIKTELIIVSRATEVGAVSKLKMAGASNVIMPDSIGGSHMASLITNPSVAVFMDYLKVQGKKGVNIESVNYAELPIEFQNKSIGELDVKRNIGVTIIGFQSPSGDYFINPNLETIIVPDSQLFILGTSEQIQKMNTQLGLKI